MDDKLDIASMLASPAIGAGLLPPKRIKLWLDPVPRTGYQNMAADELLSRQSDAWLRIYAWSKPTVSFGYFDTQDVAARIFPSPDLEYIRRWTGGGIVDHRKGYTYTVTLPAIEGEMYPASNELYQWIHGALAKALQKHGVSCQLLSSDLPDGGRACWASPVMSDIVNDAGMKLAGAGQRRYKGAVLHQGLIQECEPTAQWELSLAAALSPQVERVEGAQPFENFDEQLAQLCAEKYESCQWNDESHGRRKPSLR